MPEPTKAQITARKIAQITERLCFIHFRDIAQPTSPNSSHLSDADRTEMLKQMVIVKLQEGQSWENES